MYVGSQLSRTPTLAPWRRLIQARPVRATHCKASCIREWTRLDKSQHPLQWLSSATDLGTNEDDAAARPDTADCDHKSLLAKVPLSGPDLRSFLETDPVYDQLPGFGDPLGDVTAHAKPEVKEAQLALIKQSKECLMLYTKFLEDRHKRTGQTLAIRLPAIEPLENFYLGAFQVAISIKDRVYMQENFPELEVQYDLPDNIDYVRGSYGGLAFSDER